VKQALVHGCIAVLVILAAALSSAVDVVAVMVRPRIE
jgi:hypothetical protein